jgi:hypothetical protein
MRSSTSRFQFVSQFSILSSASGRAKYGAGFPGEDRFRPGKRTDGLKRLKKLNSFFAGVVEVSPRLARRQLAFTFQSQIRKCELLDMSEKDKENQPRRPGGQCGGVLGTV